MAIEKIIWVVVIYLLGLAVYPQAYAQAGSSETRGELLYLTHCINCHNTKIHWREKKIATDWRALKAEVTRWQSNMHLGWNEDEIKEVTHYLNAVYYHFPVTEHEDLTESDQIHPALSR
ncbi:c-type cytochrome [Nitrosomonas communis]|uniref:Cytochrome c, mono-and diheme variants n=1 Tax=Nitrosomonas communis TaxID=44574 RepID=A0A1H2Y0G5_9PROT|nr:cytochrome c [Nitrosomonas communis]SDW98550.1 Cytochrome c, mono-and diheme variants [Nitrosomonas communis]